LTSTHEPLQEQLFTNSSFEMSLICFVTMWRELACHDVPNPYICCYMQKMDQDEQQDDAADQDTSPDNAKAQDTPRHERAQALKSPLAFWR
jgi:hypothetical protein